MAYDKVIDSAQLDGAISATADAIRTKTGGTDTLPWDMNTGFASAVGEISGGDNTLTALLEGEMTELANETASVLGSYCFYHRTNLTLLDLCVTKIESYALAETWDLKTLILRADSVVTLEAVNVFDGSLFYDKYYEDGDDTSNNGTVYVPEKLMEEYVSATNWATVFSKGANILSIEGSEYE